MDFLGSRTIFLKWAIINVVLCAFFAAAYATYGSNVKGASLVAVPLILSLYALATVYAGKLCWRADHAKTSVLYKSIGGKIVHDADWLARWAYGLQIAGIMSTMGGFYLILNSGSGGDIATKIQGGSVALLGSFVGVLCSFVLLAQHWILEHELKG